MTDLATRLIQGYTEHELKQAESSHRVIAAELKDLIRRSPFANQVLSLSSITSDYSRTDYKDQALEYIEFEKIYQGVDEREKKQTETAGLPANKIYGYQDFIVMELLAWFKNDFFKWVNKPECPTCGTDDTVTNIGSTQPTQVERDEGKARGVEMYRCSRCSNTIRFPRFNNPVTLLKTRSGRCGEWCNCFMLILSAMDIQSRYVWNAEDHVWCEIYSSRQKRWVHIDCCENSFDEPMLYARGWGKKMSYVFAINDLCFVDVSKRYIDPEHQLPRNKINEKDLATIIKFLNHDKILKYRQLNGDLDSIYKKLIERNLEMLELNKSDTVVETKTSILQARESGKGDWTKERGENGN